MQNKKLIITIVGVLVALLAVHGVFARDANDPKHYNQHYDTVDMEDCNAINSSTTFKVSNF